MKSLSKLPSLRPFQRKALDLLLKPESAHVLCTAPTGSGKSLIFETAARLPGARTLIISPLRALIRQQIERLESSSLRHVPGLKEAGSFWICTPEELRARRLRGFRAPPETLLVVDECHCIEEWGPEFRPEFGELPRLAGQWGVRRSLWLSATLSAQGRSLIEEGLGSSLQQVGRFALHPELHLTRHEIPLWGRPSFLSAWLMNHPGPGLVFCSSRAHCEEVARLLALQLGDGAVAAYHAGLTREERLAIEARVRDRRLHWISATSAFGMGMDFPQFEWVLLWEPPFSLLSLTQMLGRAGRAPGARPRAALLWDSREMDRLIRRDPKSGQKIRDFYQTTDEAEVGLRQIFL